MSYCSTFSLRNSKVHQFLTTLEKELSKYTGEELRRITAQEEPDQMQRKKIELMFKVEQRRFEEMKKFQAKNNISVLDKDSNKIASNESTEYQPIFKQAIKNQNIQPQNKQRKASGFMQKQQLNGIRQQKRFSVGLFGNSDNKIDIQIPLFANNSNFSFKQDIFDIDEGSEDESVESKYSDENEEQNSEDSQDSEECFDLQDYQDTFEQKAVALSIVKQRKVENPFDKTSNYVNIFSSLKGEEKAVIILDEDGINYSIMIVNNIIQDQKLQQNDQNLYIKQLDNTQKQEELFMNIREDGKTTMFNDLNQNYQFSIKKNLHIRQFQDEAIQKEYSFDFKDDYFIHKIYDSNFGTFINLDCEKFVDNLILEQDMVFMFNQKHGFCIKEIIKSQNQQQFSDILNEKYENCDLLPLNINFDNAEQFYKKFLVPKARSFYTDKNIFQFNMKNFQQLLNEYFRKYLIERKQSFMIVGLVEYFKDYQFYKLTKNYIVFQVDLELCRFFDNTKDTHTLIHGRNLQKRYQDEEQDNIKKFKEEFFHSFNQFQGSYQLNVGFDQQTRNFYFTYQQKGKNFYSLFSQDTSAMIRFNNKQDEKIKEGLWVGLFKFDIFEDRQSNKRGVYLPYKSHLMFNKNVLHVNELTLKVAKQIICLKYYFFIWKINKILNNKKVKILTILLFCYHEKSPVYL